MRAIHPPGTTETLRIYCHITSNSPPHILLHSLSHLDSFSSTRSLTSTLTPLPPPLLLTLPLLSSSLLSPNWQGRKCGGYIFIPRSYLYTCCLINLFVIRLLTVWLAGCLAPHELLWMTDSPVCRIQYTHTVFSFLSWKVLKVTVMRGNWLELRWSI